MSTNPTYSFQFVDTITEAVIGEVALSGTRFTKVLNDSGTFEGTLTIDRKLRLKGIDPYDITMPIRRCIYVLRDGFPMWGGIIWTRRYDSENEQVSIGAADWWSYYDHRKILNVLPANPSTSYVASTIAQAIQQDQNDIARAYVQLAALHIGGNIGIVHDTSITGILRDRNYPGYELANVGDALRKLANVINGPDIMFDISLSQVGEVIRTMRIGSPILGQQGSPHVWEYGGNIQSYTWPSDGSRMATRVFAVGDGIEAGMPIAVSEDESYYPAGWPLLEIENGYSSVTTPGVLQEHADADQLSARLPVVLPELVVRGDVDPIVGTYGPGDDARVVIQDAFHTSGIDTGMRIIEMEINPSDERGEIVKLVMAPLFDDVA